MSELLQNLFVLEPQYQKRVWGGQRLKAQEDPVGELWGAFDESLVQAGPHGGMSVAELASAFGEAFLGRDVVERFGRRFPLLIKLLDCADWLSVQVHPNDEQAERLVGPGQYGKTEAWHFLEVDPETSILAGVKPGTTAERLANAIRGGEILDVAQRLHIAHGETYLIPAGTLHALGPGLLLYEVQQASDTTYRVYDWDRPPSEKRALHIEQSVLVTNPHSVPARTPRPELHGTSSARAAESPFFVLEVLQIADEPFTSTTEGRTLNVFTVTEGAVTLTCSAETEELDRFSSAILAGRGGAFTLRSNGTQATVLRATLPLAKS